MNPFEKISTSEQNRELVPCTQFEEIEKSEYSAETRKVIEHIDFDVLRGLFDTLRSRSGAEGESGFCGREKISIDDSRSGGEFYPQKGVNIGSLPFTSYDYSRPTRASFRNNILCMVIHEETHASSRSVDKKLSTSKKISESVRSLFGVRDLDYVSAYGRRQYENGKFKSVFLDLNDGITEMIAKEVYGEYLRTTGDSATFSDSKTRAEYQNEIYLGSRAMTQAFLEIIAKCTGVPSETVWGAIKQGYVTGLDFSETELSHSFEEIFSEGFIKRLSEWGSGEEGKIHKEILEKAESLELSEDVMNEIKNAFERYRIDAEAKAVYWEANQ